MIRSEPVSLVMGSGELVIPPGRLKSAAAGFRRLLESQADPLARIDVLNTGEAQLWEGDQA